MKINVHFLHSENQLKWMLLFLSSFFIFFILKEIHSFYSMEVKPPQSKPIVVLNKSIPHKKINYDVIFGAYVPADITTANIKQTMLNLELAGILFADQLEYSQVIIRTAGGEERNYRMGDSLPGGAEIKRILPDGILLQHNGSLERLNLPKNDILFQPVAKPLIKE